jgi:hypothetical protein
MHRRIFTPPPLNDRDFVSHYAYERASRSSHFIGVVDALHPAAPIRSGVVRARFRQAIRVVSTTPVVSSLRITSQLNLNGSIPRTINKAVTVPTLVHISASVLRYFANVRDPSSFDAEDSKELGRLLVAEMDAVRNKNDWRPLRAKLGTFVDHTAALRGVRDALPWFEPLLLEVLRNRLGAPKVSKKALAEFREEDARRAGRAFSNALVANVSGVTAVDEWVRTYPALGELEQR